MFINFNLYVDFLATKKLDANQFAICWMIYHRDFKNIAKYNKAVGPFATNDIKYLVEEGFILNTKYMDLKNLHLGELMVTPLFSDEILIENEFEALKELKEVFPKYFMINGKKQLTTTCDMDALARFYFKKLGGDKIMHKIIVAKTKVVARMMDSGEMNSMKLDTYIRGENWSAADLEGESGDIRRDI